jgi:hypothetical protein
VSEPLVAPKTMNASMDMSVGPIMTNWIDHKGKYHGITPKFKKPPWKVKGLRNSRKHNERWRKQL